MHKLHKFCDKFTEKKVISSRSIYYQFGSQILRVSDHIGSGSSGNFSLIISANNNYILHCHISGELMILNYEQVKQFVRTIGICSRVLSSINSSEIWKLSSTESLVTNSDTINVNSSYLDKIKHLYANLTTCQRRNLRRKLGIKGIITEDRQFLLIGKSTYGKKLFIEKYGFLPR